MPLQPWHPGTAVKKKKKERKQPNKRWRIVANINRLCQSLYSGTRICTSSNLFNDPTTAALPQQLQSQQAFARKSRPLPGLITNNHTLLRAALGQNHITISLRGTTSVLRAVRDPKAPARPDDWPDRAAWPTGARWCSWPADVTGMSGWVTDTFMELVSNAAPEAARQRWDLAQDQALLQRRTRGWSVWRGGGKRRRSVGVGGWGASPSVLGETAASQQEKWSQIEARSATSLTEDKSDWLFAGETGRRRFKHSVCF